MSEPPSSPPTSPPAAPTDVAEAIRPPLQLVRLPLDKPHPAVAFLHARSAGVMDLIAHFWERLAQMPALQRPDLHLIVAIPNVSDNLNINISQLDPARFSGAMLYVPKAHRADVLALDPRTAAAFASYIQHHGHKTAKPENSTPPTPQNDANGTLSLTDLSAQPKNGIPVNASEIPASAGTAFKVAAGNSVAIDFLTGTADSIAWIAPLLLPVVHKRQPARQFVNVVMQLPPDALGQGGEADPHVRLGKEADIPTLNRWRRLYKEERGILFDADMDASIDHGRIFVYEVDRQVVAIAKLDLDLASLTEIGGVYTFPEHRNKGYGTALVRDLARRIRAANKTPVLQVDEQNTPALRIYERAGWTPMGKLARTWLTG